MKNASLTLINGSFDGALSAKDRGLAYGDGLFETIAWHEGKAELFSQHGCRLIQGCERLGIAYSDRRLQQEWQKIRTAIPQQCQGVIKIIITRGIGARGYRSESDLAANSLFQFDEMDLSQWLSHSEQGVCVRVCALRLAHQPALASLKHLNRLEQVIARREWQDNDVFEGILLDQDEHIVEAVSANVFFCHKNKLYTPSLKLAGVAGVVRQKIIEDIAPSLNIPVLIGSYKLDQLLNARESFLCNSLYQVLPIVKIDQQTMAIGDITRSIQRQLQRVGHD